MTEKTNDTNLHGASAIAEPCPPIVNDQTATTRNSRVASVREASPNNLPPAPFMLMTDEEFNAEVERRIKAIKEGSVRLIKPAELDESIKQRKRLWV